MFCKLNVLKCSQNYYSKMLYDDPYIICQKTLYHIWNMCEREALMMILFNDV